MSSIKTTGDQLTIVNRSTEHRISKELIRKIPYFEKLLSHDLLESKESKVTLNFDEQAFKLFLNWLEFDHMLIEMKNIINLCTMMDYFGMDNNLINHYVTYFHDYFSIKHLPVIMPQVTSKSKCINTGALDAFICRYFLKIANTTAWLNYPIETIEYICNKDLMIHSEMQVFDAIMRWINFKTDSRKDYLERLLKSVRWCHLDDKDLSQVKENDHLKSPNFKPIFCTPAECIGDCTFNRINQYYFVLIEELSDQELQIKVLDRNFLPLIKQVLKPDQSMPLHLLHNEHASDIVFASGRMIIRVDWNQNKYRLISLDNYKSHCHKIIECILEKKEGIYYLTPSKPISDINGYKKSYSLHEFNENFVLISEMVLQLPVHKGTAIVTAQFFTSEENITSTFANSSENYLATILDNNVYILRTVSELIQFNIDNQKITQHKLPKSMFKGRSNLVDLILTSKPAHDDKVILIDRSKRVVDCFNVNDGEWSPIGFIADNFSPTDDQRKSNKLLTFTSAFLWIDTIRPYINCERDSMK